MNISLKIRIFVKQGTEREFSRRLPIKTNTAVAHFTSHATTHTKTCICISEFQFFPRPDYSSLSPFSQFPSHIFSHHSLAYVPTFCQNCLFFFSQWPLLVHFMEYLSSVPICFPCSFCVDWLSSPALKIVYPLHNPKFCLPTLSSFLVLLRWLFLYSVLLMLYLQFLSLTFSIYVHHP